MTQLLPKILNVTVEVGFLKHLEKKKKKRALNFHSRCLVHLRDLMAII